MGTRNSTQQVKKRDDSVDAVTLLITDHKEVKQRFKSYDALVDADAGTEEKEALAEEKEEEEELFPKVKRSKLDLQALGEEMSARKQQLMADVGVEQDA
ncbi:hypothetical protein [Piscinibacter sp.]|uniref:hypothetical protein n=1 Tax=Piscinibacter sp. TaxID=1903157 RepID=UPI002BC15E76|nr:hypothetical protein [Albitalea sp.]HUG21679.1 hypothetical protein [Albitalea sp.]